MPLQATSGAASYDAFGGGVAAVPKYIEEYFSTYLYQGTGASNTINNGIDLATKGGLVWTKARNLVEDHNLFDTARGVRTTLNSNTTAAQYQADPTYFLTAFNSNGFTMGLGDGNANGYNYTSWTLAKAPKFFDVVTYTGNGSGNRIITSSLGSPIGCIFIKRTDSTSNWATAHRKDGSAVATGLSLNTTAAALYPNSTNDTFDATGGFNAGYIVDSTGDGVNVNGATYVAYLFAHNAGGFGLTGTDNVISCGSFTTPSSGEATITLGYEPQWLMVKSSSNSSDWYMVDTMRGLSQTSQSRLDANLATSEETTTSPWFIPTATGFTAASGSIGGSRTFIYIAIRRGPMKVPTSGTSVFAPLTRNGTGAAASVTTVGFPPDMAMVNIRDAGTRAFVDKLRGPTQSLAPAETAAERTSPSTKDISSFNQNGISFAGGSDQYSSNSSGLPYVNWYFKRAPSFFDVVCYTGTGSARTITHNLAAVPELMIVKCRSTARAWPVYAAPLGNTEEPRLNESSASGSSTSWNSTTPTSSVFSVSNGSIVNASGDTYVAYLFATCAGVSKVTTFTGNGSSQTINCGFTGGARFVLIKRVDSTGNWVTFDTARGISSGNDPALYLNSTAAEVTGVDAIDPDSTGFIVNQESTFNLNVSSATYLVLAIA